MTKKMTDGGQEKIHEDLQLIFINQWLGPRELAKNIFLFQLKEIRLWKEECVDWNDSVINVILQHYEDHKECDRLSLSFLLCQQHADLSLSLFSLSLSDIHFYMRSCEFMVRKIIRFSYMVGPWEGK